MGGVIGSIIGIVTLVVAGVFTAISASKAKDCHHSRKMNIILASSEFGAAIVMLIITL